MDRELDYRFIIKSLLLDWKNSVTPTPASQSELIMSFDDEHQIYFLMELGWGKEGRIRSVYLILRIVDGKIWIEENRTDKEIGRELVAAGIPCDHIVLGLQPPSMRPYTDYAAA